MINITKNKTIGKVECGNTFYKRLKGLMFKKEIDMGFILKIPKSKYKFRSSIHMFFMRKSLEILFIDKNNKIYELTRLKPWKTYTPKKPAKYVVELKTNSIRDNNIEINDEIIFR
ncbi:MAG: DUF192 domain-containing protein [Methanobrevibacter sp.]|nr:DUF192 domain-containing protein [Methanobrevibacter sp.]